MRSERSGASALLIALLATLAGSASADDAAIPPADAQFVPMETIVSGDCWGQWPNDVLAAVSRCKPAERNRIALQVPDDADGPARVGIDGKACSGARCAGLVQVLQVAPGQRLLLRTPPARIDAVLAALDQPTPAIASVSNRWCSRCPHPASRSRWRRVCATGGKQ